MLAEACRSGLRREPRDRLNRWFRLAHCQRLDQVDWSDHAPIPHTTQRTDAALESLDLEVRSRLEAESCDLGFFGAEAILESLRDRGVEPLPSYLPHSPASGRAGRRR